MLVPGKSIVAARGGLPSADTPLPEAAAVPVQRVLAKMVATPLPPVPPEEEVGVAPMVDLPQQVAPAPPLRAGLVETGQVVAVAARAVAVVAVPAEPARPVAVAVAAAVKTRVAMGVWIAPGARRMALAVVAAAALMVVQVVMVAAMAAAVVAALIVAAPLVRLGCLSLHIHHYKTYTPL